MSVGKRIAIGVALCAVASVAACRWLLPENYAVNAPLTSMLFGMGRGAPADSEQQRMRGPDGYSVSIFATVARARMLEFTEAGDLLVSVPREDQIWRLEPDRDGDGRSDGVRPLAIELDRPHGIDLHEGWLYIGEGSRLSRVRFDAAGGATEGELIGLVDVPDGGNHWSRTLAVGPDRKLYATVGSSCNVCLEEDERRAAMLRYELDGSGYELYASGLRNSVDFDWHPKTGALYATDNGRDLLGDDFPPCELNRIERGGFYGWPIANGAKVPDPDFGAGQQARIRDSIAPAFEFAAHNAPLGMTFATGEQAPDEYRNAALIALHGSWNRTKKDGYKVISLHWRADGAIEARDFLVGFEQAEEVIGRPVDVALGPDGAFYVSDDYGGVVWRVARGGPAAAGRSASEGPARTVPSDPLAALGAEERQARSGRGAQLFEQHQCASCHDSQRAVDGVVAKPLAALGQRYTLEQLARFFEVPTPPMPVFPLTDVERRDLAVHLLATFD